MGKKKFRKGDLNWAERNLVYPLARGTDLAANDWFGERGLARGLTKAAGLPAYEEAYDLEGSENDTWQSFAPEIPRAILAAGPFGPSAMGGRTLGIINAGAAAGMARDPGEDAPEEQAKTRVWNTLLGAGVPAAMAAAGPAVGRFAYNVYHKFAHPAANAAMRRYIGTTDEAGAMLKGDPGAVGEAAETLPRYHGTTYRTNPADAFNDKLQTLEAGQTFTPGRVMSSSVNKETAHGFGGNKGASITIRNKSGRDARWLTPDEGEVLTNPNASYRVLSVERDPNTGIVTHLELEEIGPDVGLGRRLAQGAMESGAPASAGAAYPTFMASTEPIRVSHREQRRAAMERRARTKGRPISKGRDKLIAAIREKEARR